MDLQHKVPTGKGTPEMFTGDVYVDVIVHGKEPSRVRVNVVRFTPGSRTAWHRHAVGQTLHVTEGFGLVQTQGGKVQEIHAGDTIHTPAGVWHWHGANDKHFMTHLAIWEAPAPESGMPESEWGEHVSEGEYRAIKAK